MSATLIEHDGEKLVISLMHDVSAVKVLERRTRQLESKFAALFEYSPEAISLYRIRDGVRLEANAAWERVSGYSRKQVAGQPARSAASLFLSPEHRDAIIVRVEAEGAVSNVEARLVRADGSELDALISAVRIEHEGEQCILWSWRDITVERATARRAHQLERKFQALFETTPVGLIVTLPSERKVLEINDAALNIFGLRREEAVGSPTAELAHIPEGETVEEIRSRALAGERVSRHVRIVRRDGRPAELLVTAAMVNLEGEPHLILSALDVTEQRRAERERQQAESKYTAMFATNPEAVVVTRLRDGLILAQNPACERYSGYRSDQAIGRSVIELRFWVRDDDRVAGRRPARGHGQRVQLRNPLSPRGRPRDRRTAVRRAFEIEGEACAIWTWRDVSEQKQAQSRLRESEARFRALTELSADWYWEQDEHFRFVWNDGEAARAEGNRPPRYIGLTRWEAHPESLSAEQWAAHRAQLEAHQSFRDLEFQRMSNDGTMRWVNVSGYPIFDEDGAFRGYRGVGHDITERKRNEALLMNIARGVSAEVGGAFFRSLAGHLARELGADFAFIGELVSGGTHMRTLALLADGKIVEQPDYVVEGSMSAMALSEKRTVLFPRWVREQFPDNAEMKRARVEAYVGTPLYGADGSAIGVLAVANRQPIEHGQFWASMIEIFGSRAAAEIERSRAEELVVRTNTFLEQTVQERTSQLEEANRELESYSYSISHDLRQPLNAIGGFAELLREEVAGDLSPMARDFVEEIENNSVRMEQMIESLLELSRAGRSALRKSAVDAQQVVTSVLHDLAANGPLKAEVQVGELPSVPGDPVLLRQVWANLIGNAIKYSGRSAAPRVEIGGLAQGRHGRIQRARQRRRLRHAARRAAVRRLPAPAVLRRLHRQRHRPGHRRAHRAASTAARFAPNQCPARARLSASRCPSSPPRTLQCLTRFLQLLRI
jgi:PAS domain S-box-containing protein